MTQASEPGSVRLPAQIFCVPLDDQCGYLLYAPDAGAALVGNAAMVNLLADVTSNAPDRENTRDAAALSLLEKLSLFSRKSANATGLDRSSRASRRHLARVLFDGTLDVDRLETALTELLRQREASTEPLIVTYDGCNTSTACDALRELHTRGVANAIELGHQLAGHVILDNAPGEKDLNWIIRWMSGATVRLMSQSRPRHLMRRFDDAGFQYELELRVCPADLETLPQVIKSIAMSCSASRLLVEPWWRMHRGDGEPTELASAFVAAFAEAQHLALNDGCTIAMRGAQLHERIDFRGLHAHEALIDCRGHVHSFESGMLPLHCVGCFARATCAANTHDESVLDFRGSERCAIVRSLARDAILAAIERAGGIAWLGDCDVSGEQAE